MLKLIRVILGLELSGFAAGMSRAGGLLSGFLGAARSAFTGAVSFANNLINALAHLPDAIKTITDGIEGFFGGALTKERTEAIFKTLTGSAEQAGDMMQFLRDKSVGLGKDIDELIPGAQQIAVALRASNGEVDPALWEELTMAIMKFSTLRPDVPIQLWGRAISGLLNGDVSTLTRLLDVDVKNMGTLSEKVREFLEGGNEAREQQLGRVTRLGADAAGDKETALDALREILDAVGATDELLEESANTTQGKLDQLKAQWEDFVDRVALELLPILTEALDGLLKWIEDHEDEINTFLKGFGEFAREAWDKLKNVDFAELADSLERVAATSFEDAKEFLQGTDWQEILDAVVATAQAINAVNEFFHPEQETWIDKAVNGPSATVGSRPGNGPSLIEALNGQGELQGPIGDFMRWINQSQSTTPAPQVVELRIHSTVDENGNIVPIVRRVSQEEANTVVANMVSTAAAKTGGGKYNNVKGH